jgi:hypothetical protein
VNLEILAWLTFDKDSSHDATRRRAAVQGVATAAAKADPANGYLRIVAALAGSAEDAPLSAADLHMLEAAVQQPRLLFPRAQLHAELLRTATALDPKHAEYRAMSSLMGIAPSAPLALRRRAEATKDKALQVRAARVLTGVGAAFANSGVLLDHIAGLVLTRDAARISGDSSAFTAADRAVKDEDVRQDVWRSASNRLGFWPLPSLWRERMPDFSRERRDIDLLIED